MSIVIELSPAAVGVGSTVLLLAFGGAFYLGDTRWPRRSESSEEHKKIEDQIEDVKTTCDGRHLSTTNTLAMHAARLEAGDRAISRIEGMLQAQNNTLSQIQAHVAGIEGELKARRA